MFAPYNCIVYACTLYSDLCVRAMQTNWDAFGEWEASMIVAGMEEWQSGKTARQREKERDTTVKLSGAHCTPCIFILFTNRIWRVREWKKYDASCAFNSFGSYKWPKNNDERMMICFFIYLFMFSWWFRDCQHVIFFLIYSQVYNSSRVSLRLQTGTPSSTRIVIIDLDVKCIKGPLQIWWKHFRWSLMIFIL